MSASFIIPQTQRAAVVSKGKIQIKEDVQVKSQVELAPGECLVKLHCSGVCHSDLHVYIGDWPALGPGPPPAVIGGHEGVGEIVAIGSHTSQSLVKLGDRVGVKITAYQCRNCALCSKGLDQHCHDVKSIGFAVDGTFSQYVVSSVHSVTPIPDSLSSYEAAPLLCAGITVYSALKHSRTNPGEWVVIPGAGGGLGHLAVQYAKYLGRRVIAIDTGDEKKKLCLDLGADQWIDFKESSDICAEIRNATGGLGAHATLITSSSASGYQVAIDYLRKGGTLMAIGLPGTTKLETSIFFTVIKAITIIGSYIGNRHDSLEAIDIAARGHVKSHYVLKTLDDLPSIFDDLEKGKTIGRVVIDVTK